MIRKGRKQRQRLADLDSLSSSKYNSNEDNLSSNVPSPVFPASINIPSSRHSIDLGASSVMMMTKQQQQQQLMHSSSSGNSHKVPVHSTSHHASLNSARYVIYWFDYCLLLLIKCFCDTHIWHKTRPISLLLPFLSMMCVFNVSFALLLAHMRKKSNLFPCFYYYYPTYRKNNYFNR